MSKQRQRRGPEPGEFQDPLKNYDPATFADDFEQSLCQDTVAAIGHQPYTSVPPQTIVLDVLRLMAERNIACIVVADEHGYPVGIFTEQDVARRIAPRYDEAVRLPVEQVMTRDPVVVYESQSPARVLHLMGGGYFRHLPVCDVAGKLIGVIGARRVIAYLQQHTERAGQG